MTYYVTDFLVFAPFYTVLCLVVFTLLRLYGGMWRYAGLNDLNRMIAASLMTCAIHVAGTMLFVCRMPITYDVIGWFIVLYFIGAYFRLYDRHWECLLQKYRNAKQAVCKKLGIPQD